MSKIKPCVSCRATSAVNGVRCKCDQYKMDRKSLEIQYNSVQQQIEVLSEEISDIHRVINVLDDVHRIAELERKVEREKIVKDKLNDELVSIENRLAFCFSCREYNAYVNAVSKDLWISQHDRTTDNIYSETWKTDLIQLTEEAEGVEKIIPTTEDWKELMLLVQRAVGQSQIAGQKRAPITVKLLRYRMFLRFLSCDKATHIAQAIGMKSHYVRSQLDVVADNLRRAIEIKYVDGFDSVVDYTKNAVGGNRTNPSISSSGSSVNKIFRKSIQKAQGLASINSSNRFASALSSSMKRTVPARVLEMVVSRNIRRYRLLIEYLLKLAGLPKNALKLYLAASMMESGSFGYAREVSVLQHVCGLLLQAKQLLKTKDHKLRNVRTLANGIRTLATNNPEAFVDELLEGVKHFEFYLFCRNWQYVAVFDKSYGGTVYRERKLKGEVIRKLNYREFKTTWVGALNV